MLLSGRPLLDRGSQEGYGLGVQLVSGRGLVVFEASGELVGVLEDLVNGSRHVASLKEPLPGAHGVDDDHGHVAFDVTNFEDDGRSICTDHHREPVTEIPDSDGVPVGVENVLLAQTVLQGRWRNDRILEHPSKVTCT